MVNLNLKDKNLSVSGLEWNLKENLNNNLNEIREIKNLPEVLKTILYKRNLFEMNIEDYLSPSLKKLFPNPFSLHDMDKAVDIFIKAIFEKEKIGILGDYDVDGTSSSALIFNYFRELKLNNVEVYIPDRENDGYGFSQNALNYFIKKKVKTLLCLDCATNDMKNIKEAQGMGLKVVIIDHHEQNIANNSEALINPKKNIDKSGLNYLATVGLSFLFVVALNRVLKNKNYFDKNLKEPNLKKYLDLVALGTICDMVPLKKVNRLFVKKGVREINKKKNIGISTLTEKLKIEKKLSVSDIGFYIGPCINAPGRIGDSSLGFKLLSSNLKPLVFETANTLLKNNRERKTLENIVCAQAMSKILQIKQEGASLKRKFILVYDNNWHSGIIGLIASKLTKKFNIPSIVVSIKKKMSKGSIRSVEGVNVTDVIDVLKKNKCITNGGGHSLAGGFSIDEICLEKLTFTLDKYFSNIPIKRKEVLEIDAVIDLQSINNSLIKSIKDIGPFGQENEEPIVVLSNVKPTFFKKVGKLENHIFCIFEDIYGDKINGIAFNHANSGIGNAILMARSMNVAGKLEIYESENKTTPQIVIEDILIL